MHAGVFRLRPGRSYILRGVGVEAFDAPRTDLRSLGNLPRRGCGSEGSFPRNQSSVVRKDERTDQPISNPSKAKTPEACAYRGRNVFAEEHFVCWADRSLYNTPVKPSPSVPLRNAGSGISPI